MLPDRRPNPLQGLAQGIQNAANQVAGLFAKRAERNYQEGVAAKTESKAERDRARQLLESQDLQDYFRKNPEEEIALQGIVQWYDETANADPLQARQRMQEGPPPGGVVTNVEKNAKFATGQRTSGAQGARGAPQEVVTGTRRTTEAQPTQQFLGRLGRQVSQREFQRGVETELMFENLSHDQQLELQDRGFSHDLTMADLELRNARTLSELSHNQQTYLMQLRNLHELRMQGNDEEFQVELAKLRSNLGITEAKVQHDLTTAENNQLFEQQKELSEINFGQEVDLTKLNTEQQAYLTRLGHLNELRRMGRSDELERERMRLATDLAGEQARDQGVVQAWLRRLDEDITEARDQRLFEQKRQLQEEGVEQQKEIMGFEQADRTLSSRLEDLRNTSLPMSTREGVAGELRALRERLPEEMRWRASEEVINSALGTVNEEAREAARTELAHRASEARTSEAQATEAELRAAHAEEFIDQELQIGERNISLLDLQVDRGYVDMEGQQLRNERLEFDNRIAEFDHAADYVEEAVALGMPERVSNLLEEVRNPGTHPELSEMAQQTSEQELVGAYETAREIKNLEGKERSVTHDQLDSLRRDISRGDIQSRSELVNQLADSHSPDEILHMAENDETMRDLIADGLLSQGDINSAVNKARLRQQVQQDEANGTQVEITLDTLDRLAQAPDMSNEEAISEAENAVRDAAGRLVDMGYLDESQVAGFVAQYRQAWQDQADITEADLEATRASTEAARAGIQNDRAQLMLMARQQKESELNSRVQRDLWRAQIGSQRALANSREAQAAAAEAGTGAMDPDAFKETRLFLEAEAETIRGEMEEAGCVDQTGNPKNTDECQTFRDRLNEVSHALRDTRTVMMGGRPDPNSRDSAYPEIGKIYNMAEPSQEDLRWLMTAVDTLGGPEAVAAELGIDSDRLAALTGAEVSESETEEPEEGSGDGPSVGALFNNPGTQGVVDALNTPFSQRAAEGVRGIAGNVAGAVGSAGRAAAGGASRAAGNVAGGAEGDRMRAFRLAQTQNRSREQQAELVEILERHGVDPTDASAVNEFLGLGQ